MCNPVKLTEKNNEEVNKRFLCSLFMRFDKQERAAHLLGFTPQNICLLLKISLQFQQLVLTFAVLFNRSKISPV